MKHEESRKRNEELVKEAKTGKWDIRQLAVMFDVTEANCRQILQKYEVTPKKMVRGPKVKSNKKLPLNERSESFQDAVTCFKAGWKATEVALYLGCSRQRVYQLRNQAIEAGFLEKPEKVVVKSTCEVCKKEFEGTNKTCSKTCRNRLISTSNTKNSKWSRNTMTTYTCKKCGTTFQRSNYHNGVRERGLEKAGKKSNDFFCSRSCNIKYQHEQGRVGRKKRKKGSQVSDEQALVAQLAKKLGVKVKFD